MADFPSMPWWTDRYLADTRHLNRAQHGSYCLLLMEAWRRPRCCLPDDDKLLAQLACCSPEEWSQEKPVIMAFWTLDRRSREWTQKGQLKERAFVEEQRQKQRNKARKRWNAEGKDDAAGMPRECRGNAPTPTPTPTPTQVLNGGGGVARARESDPHDEILMAAGIDPTKDVTGKWHGPEQIRIVDRWRAADFSQEEIIAEIRGVGLRSPPQTLAYFNPVFERALASRNASPLQPAEGAVHDVRRSRAAPRSTASLEAFIAGARTLP